MRALLVVLAAARVASAEPIAIVGAKVCVKPGQVLDSASVVIDKGKIVGVNVATPAGARVIDGKGKFVTAGFIDGVSGVGLVGIDLEPSVVDGRFGPIDPVHEDPVHASYEARDGFDPRAVAVPVARGGGITAVVAAPLGGLVSGRSAAYALDGSATPLRAPTAMHVELGASGSGATGGSRGLGVQLLRELLDDARAFAKDRASYERNAKRRMIADRLDLDALQPVLRRQIPLVIEAEAEADIRAALRVAADYKLDIAIAGATEAWRLAPELAKAKVPVILDPTANLPANLAASDVNDEAAAVLAKAGVRVAISTLGSAGGARTLRQLAGNAVARGLTWDQAIAAMTTVPAALYGLKGRGTLEKGSVADVVVWSGDPLETTTAAEVVIIGGVVQSLESHQTRLFERYRVLPPR